MKVSVIIPARNEEKYIKQCLKGLLQQQEKADEILVVDSNSTDNTTRIAKQMGVRVVKQEVSGIALTRNKGFDSANFEIIARCDADSLVPFDWIKLIKKNFLDDKIDALVGPISYYDLPTKTLLYSKIFIHFMHVLLGHHIIIGNNMAISKEIWKKVREKACVNDKDVHEDIDIAIHIAKEKGIIKYDPKFIAYTSARRILRNPKSFFIEYPRRLIHMLRMRH